MVEGDSWQIAIFWLVYINLKLWDVFITEVIHAHWKGFKGFPVPQVLFWFVALACLLLGLWPCPSRVVPAPPASSGREAATSNPDLVPPAPAAGGAGGGASQAGHHDRAERHHWGTWPFHFSSDHLSVCHWLSLALSLNFVQLKRQKAVEDHTVKWSTLPSISQSLMATSETLDTFSPIPIDMFLEILPLGRLGSSFS